MLDVTTNNTAYKGGEGQSVFPIPFPFLETAHIRAHIRDSAGNARALAGGIEYSVNRVSDANGELILLGADLSADETLTITRLVPLTQEILFHNQGPNSPKAVEEAVDKLTMIAQQLQGGLDADHTHGDLKPSEPSAPALHAAAHAAGGSDPIRPADIGVLPAPPPNGKAYLAASGGWIEYVAPAPGGPGDDGAGPGGGTTDHARLVNRDAADQHPQSAILNLPRDLADIRTNLSALEATKADVSRIPTIDLSGITGRVAGLESRIGALGAMASAADAPANGKPHMRQGGAWVEYAEPEPADVPPGGGFGGGGIIGEIRFLPFRASELPDGWYFCDGSRYPLSSPQGIALSGLPATMKTDWGIITAGSSVSVPNLLSEGKGYFVRAVDSASRCPGSKQTDAIRNITGSFSLAPAAGVVWVNTPSGKSVFTGALKAGPGAKTASFSPANLGYNSAGDLFFDASACVPTGDENRPMNIGMTPAIHLGV